ncbi:MAG TPA: diguanylate cyclase [Conexibacter sp.]|nr:diguanylate cyclase [Conexibacter sp.]
MSEVERRRAEAIASLGLLEQAGDSALTALVRLGTYVTGAGAGAVHLFTEESQHRVAAVGAPLGEHPREDSMCRLVVDEEQRVVCADATRDLRFGYSSFVRGPEPVRFYLSVPLRVSGGEVIGTLCAWDTQARELDDEQLARFDDVAEQAVWRLELTRIARDVSDAACRDPLTGAVNRLLLGDRLAHAFGRRLRHGGEVLVVVIDVDDFKQVNDTYGHDVGDEVLVAIAQRLTGATRPQDTVARLGGDQFVVVAEVPDTHAALDVWERIEEAISGTIHVGETAEAVFMTVGATFAQPGDDPRTAIARADREMYSRKPSRVEDLADGDAAA